jgi:hypothetical protein
MTRSRGPISYTSWTALLQARRYEEALTFMHRTRSEIAVIEDPLGGERAVV